MNLLVIYKLVRRYMWLRNRYGYVKSNKLVFSEIKKMCKDENDKLLVSMLMYSFFEKDYDEFMSFEEFYKDLNDIDNLIDLKNFGKNYRLYLKRDIYSDLSMEEIEEILKDDLDKFEDDSDYFGFDVCG